MGGGRSYHEPELYIKEKEKEQELSRLKTTPAQRVFRVLYTAFGVPYSCSSLCSSSELTYFIGSEQEMGERT